MIYTTLNKIREHSPCVSSWEKLLESIGKTKADGDPLAMVHILNALNVQDFFWATRALPEFKKVWVGLACDMAEHVLPIFEVKHPCDKRPRKCIEVIRSWLIGGATIEEVRDAAYAAYAARAAADVAYATRAAAYAVRAAACVIRAAAGDAYAAADAAACATDAVDDAYAERKWQAARIREVLEATPEKGGE